MKVRLGTAIRIASASTPRNRVGANQVRYSRLGRDSRSRARAAFQRSRTDENCEVSGSRGVFKARFKVAA